ncbi:EscS/YscS/HrcS family type III secretion system export apparatus protein [bacterium K02(2017)]|nr:EscS/YscS/HrcS family type III secretion system export apparatus protein [bacterium K02(2017)]
MSIDLIITIAQKSLYSAMLIVAPILVASFVVGIMMSLAQAIFQIHEYTFSFVPKLIAIFLSMIVFAPWMLSELIKLSNTFLGEGYKYVQ